MIGTYTQYFQKSKVFLYPLLQIKKGEDFVPVETYILWEGLYDESKFKYICIYRTEKTMEYKLFEDRVLKNHRLLECSVSLSNKKHLYVFDYSSYKHDFEMFINGKYSKFSLATKNKILKYFGKVGKISDYIKSFLNPEEYHEIYAEALMVDIQDIRSVYEVCSIPDIDKETLKEKIPHEFAVFKNNSLPLDQN